MSRQTRSSQTASSGAPSATRAGGGSCPKPPSSAATASATTAKYSAWRRPRSGSRPRRAARGRTDGSIRAARSAARRPLSTSPGERSDRPAARVTRGGPPRQRGGARHDRPGGCEVEAAGEDPDSREQGPVGRLKEVIAPPDRGPQRPLAGWGVGGSMGQDVEPLIESAQKRLWCQEPRASRGEFDRERYAVNSATDLGDRLRVGVVELERWIDCASPIDEQLDRLDPSDLRGRNRISLAGASSGSRAGRWDIHAPRGGAAAPDSLPGRGDRGIARAAHRSPVRRHEVARGCPGSAAALRSPIFARRVSRIVRRGCLRTPSAAAIVVGTRSASRIGARSTKTTPSGNRSDTVAPTSRATRVLPFPPVPVSVTRRSVARSASTSAISRRRPTVRPNGLGSLAAGRSSSLSILRGF